MAKTVSKPAISKQFQLFTNYLLKKENDSTKKNNKKK